MTGAQLAVAPSESVTEIVKPVIFSDSGVHVSVTLVTLPPALLFESTDKISSLIVNLVPLVELDEFLPSDITAASRTVTLNVCTDVIRKLMSRDGGKWWSKDHLLVVVKILKNVDFSLKLFKMVKNAIIFFVKL